jgi:hypothetical protein
MISNVRASKLGYQTHTEEGGNGEAVKQQWGKKKEVGVWRGIIRGTGQWKSRHKENQQGRIESETGAMGDNATRKECLAQGSNDASGSKGRMQKKAPGFEGEGLDGAHAGEALGAGLRGSPGKPLPYGAVLDVGELHGGGPEGGWCAEMHHMSWSIWGTCPLRSMALVRFVAQHGVAERWALGCHS